MNWQDYTFKIEELKAVVGLYQQAQQNMAQGQVLVDSARADESLDASAKEEMLQHEQQLRAGLSASENMLLQRTKSADVGAAILSVQEHVARSQHFDQLRGEQLRLQIAVELAKELGTATEEQLMEAEAKLGALQVQMDTLLRMAKVHLPSMLVIV
jgi:hypothetical protein